MKNHLEKIIQNVIANLVTYGVIAVLAIVIALLRNEDIVLIISVSVNVLLIGICLWLLIQRSKNHEAVPKMRKREISFNEVGQLEKAQPMEQVEVERVKQYNLLPDPKKMTELNLDNSFLTEVHGRLHAEALKWSNDAQLISFLVDVHPFRKYGAKVDIQIRFFSAWGRQSRGWSLDDSGIISEVGLPTHEKGDRLIFGELPWLQFPDWLEMVQKAYIQVGQLPEVEDTYYMAHTDESIQPKWLLHFNDGVSGREYNYRWSPETGLEQW